MGHIKDLDKIAEKMYTDSTKICEICKTKFEVDQYDDSNKNKCPKCGQLYNYNEGLGIVLTDEQIQLLYKEEDMGHIEGKTIEEAARQHFDTFDGIADEKTWKDIPKGAKVAYINIARRWIEIIIPLNGGKIDENTK